jgi:TonB family protein
VQLTVQVDGVPKDIKIAKGSRPDLNESALDAVRQWRFQPALKDGEPVEKTVVLEVSF